MTLPGSKLGAQALAENMAEIHPPLSPRQAVIEARRCLFCFDAPCIRACPTEIDVPSFIWKIAQGNPTGAARAILDANILGASCARVCPTDVLCEGACVVKNLEGGPVKIGLLQRHATDHVGAGAVELIGKSAKQSKRRVAVIGGGPAGLACAAELARLGHQAVIFEKNPKAGGLNTYGVAYYKMKPKTSLAEVELVRSLGVEIRCPIEIGSEVPISQLHEDYDAIFIGIGLGESRKLRIPGEDFEGVRPALDFIRQIHERPHEEIPVGERVAVIGGGNTAIDAATQSRRLGAKLVTVIYHRGEKEMPAYDFEYEHAKADGVQFIFNAAVTEILSEQEEVRSLRLARTQRNSRGELEILRGSEWVETFDMVIPAIGQEKPPAALIKLFPNIALDSRGAVQCNSLTRQTNLPKIFAGGDCANGGREVVHAAAEGKRAARGIHTFLTGEEVTGPITASRLGGNKEETERSLENWIRGRA